MGRGGTRPGAGRKPNADKGVVLGMDGARRPDVPLPPAISAEERTDLLSPPDDLADSAKVYWRKWAARAIAERTLIPSTEAGFRELCIRMANVQAIDDRIALLGIATQDALPYLKERRGQSGQLAVSLKDFKLTAFGKPATSEKPKPAANPWAQMGAR